MSQQFDLFGHPLVEAQSPPRRPPAPRTASGVTELFLRYPGSKAKLCRHILAAMPDFAAGRLWATKLKTYAEPFFGTGAIGWQLIRLFPDDNTVRVLINDKDLGIASLWKCVRDVPDDLVKLVEDFEPSAQAFYEFKARDGDLSVDVVQRAFEKIALHQTSFSGLGYKAGGPLGGRDGRGRSGKGEYDVKCRWRVGRLVKGIYTCNARLRAMKDPQITCKDFEPFLSALRPGDFAYLDPPYYLQGPALYRHSMSHEDHARLASLLRRAPFRWLLSYDDRAAVRDLYAWAEIRPFEMTPTVRTSRTPRRKSSELLITPKEQP